MADGKIRKGKPRQPKFTAAMNKVPKPRKNPDAALLEEARKRFQRCVQSEAANRKEWLEDLKFFAGEQWPADVKADRSSTQRPCLTFNKLPTFVNQVTNDQRQNPIGINLSPVGNDTNLKAAQTYAGMVRAIQRESNADIAYDTAFQTSVAAGLGYWRVTTEYERDDSFDQVLRIRRIPNIGTVYLDPDHSEPDGSDAKFGFITEMVPGDEFRDMYPDAQEVQFELGGLGDSYKPWVSKDEVRVAEYFVIEEAPFKLVRLSNGHVGAEDELSQDTLAALEAGELEIVEERESSESKVMWYKLTAIEVLDRTEILSDGMLPIVKVVGDEININGKTIYSGVVRKARDAQRMYNYWRTTEAETLALQPKAPFVLEEGQVEGHEDEWQAANRTPLPYITYKGSSIGGRQVPPPQRQPGLQGSTAIMNAVSGSAQDMQAVTGIRFDATIGERTYDESGKALREMRRVGDLGSYHYIDNLARSLKYTGRLLVAMIPHYYTSRRVITTLSEDGKERPVQIDPSAPKPFSIGRDKQNHALQIFNPNIGKYGVAVTVGPSFATKRIEAAEQMMDFVTKVPRAAQFTADLIAKNMDWPGSDQFAARLAKTLPPGMLEVDNTDLSPEVQALIASLKQAVMIGNQKLMLLNRQLQSMNADRMIAIDKNKKDFDARVLSTLQKALAADMKAGDSRFDRTMQVLQHIEQVLQQQDEPAVSQGVNPMDHNSNGN